MKAVKTFEQCPIEKRPANVPLNYIWQFQDTDQLELDGFTVLNDEQFNLIISEQDDWFWNNLPQNVPSQITMRQARQALVLSGISLSSVEAAINSLPSPQKELAMIEWEYSSAVLRSNPLVNMIAQQMNWTSVDVDHLFIQAVSL
jgi:hypothetical protein